MSKQLYYRVYVGPTEVKPQAERMRQAGFLITVLGTAHIHFMVRDTASCGYQKTTDLVNDKLADLSLGVAEFLRQEEGES